MNASGTEQVFRLPDLGEGLTEAEIVHWRVAVGDVIEVDQIVVDVETAKAAVDVPSPIAGTVVRLYGDAGAVLDVGAPLIAVSPGGTSGVPRGGAGRLRQRPHRLRHQTRPRGPAPPRRPPTRGAAAVRPLPRRSGRRSRSRRRPPG